jgi:hypothetical protein
VPRPDQEYVVQGRTDQIRTYIQKIQNLHIKIMHGIIASSQRTVDGTPRKEFNKKLRTSDQQNKNNFWTHCVTLNKTPGPDLHFFKRTRGVVDGGCGGMASPNNLEGDGIPRINERQGWML